jgi:hypothetical protein
MSEELKACPFCGGKAITLPRKGNWAGCASEHWIWMHTDAWQSRPIEDALRKQLEMAKEAIKISLDNLRSDAESHPVTIGILEEALSEIERIKDNTNAKETR